VLSVLSACGPATQPPVGRGLETYTIDVSHFDGGGAVRFNNASLAFRPDLGTLTQVITNEADNFRKIYNRLPCQAPGRSTNDELADQGFQYFGADALATTRPVRLEAISLELPDDGTIPLAEICFAYRTSDAKWHGRFEPKATTHDDAAKLSRATLQVQADNVDVVGIVVYTGLLSSLSFVARYQ
jgi:hypothetical protein